MIRVLVADDEALIRTGIMLILGHAEDMEVVAEAADGRAAVEAARRQAVDVALLDIRMPGGDGLAAAEEIARVVPRTKVVMLTTFGEDGYVARALRVGAAGFLLKDTPPAELIRAVRTVAAGDAFLSPQITRKLIEQHLATQTPHAETARTKVARLSEKERQVLVAVAEGRSNAETARALHMGESTVKAHLSQVLAKLDCANRVQAAIVAHDAGLLPPAS
ncbi:response regulator transcription factor [Streptomyces griseochromogenes]|uniref:response regulator transcription factor n=1 Tax=Streptomyces griseochromogenes TaxID=68214 RepID=UPI00378F0E37